MLKKYQNIPAFIYATALLLAVALLCCSAYYLVKDWYWHRVISHPCLYLLSPDFYHRYKQPSLSIVSTVCINTGDSDQKVVQWYGQRGFSCSRGLCESGQLAHLGPLEYAVHKSMLVNTPPYSLMLYESYAIYFK